MAVLRVGLLGFGTVGSSFAEVLAASKANDIRLTRVFNRGVERKKSHERAKFVPADAVWTDRVEDVLDASDVDVVVELMGGWIRLRVGCGRRLARANRWLRRTSSLSPIAAPRCLRWRRRRVCICCMELLLRVECR